MAVRFRFIFFALCGVLITCEVAACGGDDLRPDGFVGDHDASVPNPPPSVENEPRDADAPQTTMRVAHVAPNVGPIDFCYQAAKTGSFVGPVLRGGASSSDAGMADGDAASVVDADTVDAGAFDASTGEDAGTTSTIAYRTLSKYFTLAVAGPLTVAIVHAGATTCASPLVTGDVTLDPGKLSTVALFGGASVDGGSMLTLAAFTDDRTTSAGKARVRVIHAALGTGDVEATGPLALRAVAATTTTVADRVEPKRASSPSQAIPVDELGYATIMPVAPPTSLAIAPASAGQLGDAATSIEPWQSGEHDLGLGGGSLHTAFVLSAESGHAVLWCADRSTRGALTACTVVR